MKRMRFIFLVTVFCTVVLFYFFLSAENWGAVMLEKNKSLTPEQYRIMKENGTEEPFNNAYWNNKRQGVYVDVITGEVLFSSKDKFDSGTGWPSFTKAVERDSIIEKPDTSYGRKRVEVRSKSSDAHLGHVFDDGPQPTGKRYCINSAALKFIPTETAYFGAGCFWGVEEALRKIDGVVLTTVGYMGGSLKNPTYEEVSSHKTGHAETVEVQFDPKKVSYEKLLEVFFVIHDPTTPNRQGPDVGSQYRSVIFYNSAEQAREANALKEKLEKSGKFKNPIVTEITAAKEFYKAEDYHQKYYALRGIAPTCHIPPKQKF